MSFPDLNEPTIRHATLEDVPVLLDLIHALAAYEKASSSVEATADGLRSTLSFALPPASPSQLSSSQTLQAYPTFSPGHARTLLITDPDGTIAGFALYFFNYSTWRGAPGVYLEDLFVREAYRKRGYGKLLFKELARVVQEVQGKRLEWAVLKWNKPSIDFYKSLGAQALDEWQGMRLDGDALKKLAE